MAPSVLKSILAAFSPRGDYLAVCAGDGRVKTWDAVSGSVRGDFADLSASTNGTDPLVDGHLAVDFTCMAWSPVTKKGKKKQGSSLILGLGTGSGDVLLLDVALGQLKWRSQDCHPGGVKSLAFEKSGNILYTAGADGIVCELDVDSGQLREKFRASKRVVSCICVSEDGKYLVAGSSDLRLFELTSKKRICKFTGHPDAVKALVFMGDNKHFFSSATGERHVTLWHNDGNKKSAAAVCSLSMEQPAVALDCSGEFSESMRVLAVSEAGIAYVWHASNVTELSKSEPIKVSVEHIRGEASPGKRRNVRSAVLAAKFTGRNDKGPGSLLVAFGTTVKPVFEQISLEGKGNTILLQENAAGVLIPAAQVHDKVESNGLSEVRVLGSDNAVDVDKPRSHLEVDISPTKPSKRKKRASVESTERLDLGDKITPVSEDEETMEEKLKALGILEDGVGDADPNSDTFSTPKANSLLVLMTQALESDDKPLLEQCLAVTDEEIIMKTMQLLKPSNVVKFLQLSIFKIDSRTNRGLVLVPWIKAALLHHASYIMSSPSMQSVLSSLYQAIDARLVVFKSLLSLSGKLDLIMAQVSNNQTTQPHEVIPAVTYEESSDDEDEGEVEDIMENDDNMNDSSDYGDDDISKKNTSSAKNSESLDDMEDSE